MTDNEIATEIVDAAFKVHTTLGPGLLESVYEAVLAHEIARRSLEIQRQVPIPVSYENLRFDIGFRADLIVGGLVNCELKSVERVHPVHNKQLLTSVKLADLRLGLLLNASSCGSHASSRSRDADKLRRTAHQGRHHAPGEPSARVGWRPLRLCALARALPL